MQGLLGLQWTGEMQQSLLVEAWHDGTARVVDDDPALEARVYAALLEKYGWQMAIGNFTSRLFGRIGRRKILTVELKL